MCKNKMNKRVRGPGRLWANLVHPRRRPIVESKLNLGFQFDRGPGCPIGHSSRPLLADSPCAPGRHQTA